ncbi:predicted protein [Chaetoceros tenuissimus]|uniref:Uncharacterized protein n=1 Tax=Chaetoceros tenuissimus TaxID=426638 RepID=A0AAD3CJW4_9STRA|nr:predicted protein [Chaetoceros tenuissimus]
MEFSKLITTAIDEKKKILETWQAKFEKQSEKTKNDRKAKIKAHISSDELDNMQNFFAIKKNFGKLIDAVKLEGKDEAELGFALVDNYRKLDDLLDEIYSQNVFQIRNRSSLDWFLFATETRYFKSNRIVPKTNRARNTLLRKIEASENDDEITTNDDMFPESNISTENKDDDINKNNQAQCSLDVTIDFLESFDCSMSKAALKSLAKRCFRNASQLVYVKCVSTAQMGPIDAWGRIYFNMEYHEQRSDGNAILKSYITLVDEYIGDLNICIHHFVSQIVTMVKNSTTQSNLPRLLFFAKPSNQLLSLYPCPLKLRFNNTIYCGIDIPSLQAILKADQRIFQRYTKDKSLSILHFNLFQVNKNKFTMNATDRHRDGNNKICTVSYEVPKFATMTVKGDSQKELCQQIDTFTSLSGQMLEEKIQQYTKPPANKRKLQRFVVNVDGHGRKNQCVYDALKCAIHGLAPAKVKQLPPPSSSMAYTSSKKSLSKDTAQTICKQLKFQLQYLLNGKSAKERLNAVLQQSSDVANRMLLVSLEIDETNHSHCICIDLRDTEPKIVIDCEKSEALTQQNLNKQCGDGLHVSGLCFILWIYEGSKPKRGRKYNKKTSNKKSKAK